MDKETGVGMRAGHDGPGGDAVDGVGGGDEGRGGCDGRDGRDGLGERGSRARTWARRVGAASGRVLLASVGVLSSVQAQPQVVRPVAIGTMGTVESIGSVGVVPADEPAADPVSGCAPWPLAAARPGEVARPLPLALEPVLRLAACRAVAWRRAGVELQAAQAQRDQARAAYWPQWSVATSRTRIAGVDAGSQERSVSGRWTVLDFGARAAAVRAGEQGIQAAEAERQARWLQALASTVDLYADALAADGRLTAARANVDSARTAERVAAQRQRGGAASLGETLQAQRARSQAALELTRAGAARERALHALALALGLPASAALQLDAAAALDEAMPPSGPGTATPTTPTTPATPATPAGLPLAEHPQRRAAEARQMQAQDRLAAARAERWGAVQIDGSLSRVKDSAGGYSSRTVGLSWSLPLLDGGLGASRQREAEAQVEAARLDAEQAARGLRQQRLLQQTALDGEREALQESARLLAAAEQAWDVVQERFRLGVSSYTELLATQDALAAARLQRAGAQAEWLRARWQLALAGGLPLPEGLMRP
ncbi:TolC family protein [Pseudaquabacterium rugosum]|uniref:TolC family protein n=1 Tax=Pseudaquabacterium rugosum TaxID=2984194 RepID=A0ABU9BBM9_9BURK